MISFKLCISARYKIGALTSPHTLGFVSIFLSLVVPGISNKEEICVFLAHGFSLWSLGLIVLGLWWPITS